MGDAQIGKTRLLMQTIGGQNVSEYGTSNKYIPTLGVEVHKWKNYNVWDMAGDERFGGLRDGYLVGANHALILWDGKKKPTKWIQMCKCVEVPFTLVLASSNLLPEIPETSMKIW